MASIHDIKEQERLSLQAALDAQKTQIERNRLGQFATPTALAEDILRYAASIMQPDTKIRFLDPAIGTGSFYSALRKVFPPDHIIEALGFEIDPHYSEPSAQLWKDTGLVLRHADFTQAEPVANFNLLICNPPYVRHHHLKNGDKTRLQHQTHDVSGMKISGLAGLYCYFLGLSHAWMAKGCLAGWLIPSEFMNVNYGKAIKRYLLERVTLLHIHRFDPNDVQFSDALVSSSVVWFRNERPPLNHEVKFTFGGTLLVPNCSRVVAARVLADEQKWTRFPMSDVRSYSTTPMLSNFFHIKRGIATGDNAFFILSEAEIAKRRLPKELFTPILPSPRYLHQDEIKARTDGSPDIERRLFLLDTEFSEEEIQRRFPTMAVYIEEGRKQGLPERYICQHRTPWYRQEVRPPAPIVCTYLGRGDNKRGKPFRFILNASCATVANAYLALYPKPILSHALDSDPALLRKIWITLNSLPVNIILGESRVYGGGLHKLEPQELGNVPASFIAEMLPQNTFEQPKRQLNFKFFAEV